MYTLGHRYNENGIMYLYHDDVIRLFAAQQGYNKLLDILKDGLRDKEDPFLLFFMEQLEPIYQALETNDMQLLFDTLKLKRYPITKKAEKVKWKNLQSFGNSTPKKQCRCSPNGI